MPSDKAVSEQLRQTLATGVPDVWAAVRQRIMREHAQRLLDALSGPPSPTGIVLSDLRSDMTRSLVRKLERSA